MHHQNLVLLALKLLLRDRKVKKNLRTFVMCRRLSKVETDYANFSITYVCEFGIISRVDNVNWPPFRVS